MFAKSAEKLSQQLLHHNVIAMDQYEICRYGFQQGLTVLLNFVTIAAIALVMREFLCAMLFLAAFIPLRRNAGGFHAKTPLRCYLYSVGMMIAILLAIKLSFISRFICIILVSVSLVFVITLAPVEDKHKPLDKLEHTVYKKRTLIVSAIEFILFLASIVLHMDRVLVCLTWALTVAALLVILGKYRNRVH